MPLTAVPSAAKPKEVTMPKPKKKTHYVSVYIYVTAEDPDQAEEIVTRRLDRVREKRQFTPYQITDSGECEDEIL